MPETIACNFCQNTDVKPVYGLADYRFEVDDHVWPIVSCRKCGLKYLNPRPTPDEIGRYYPDAYYANGRGIDAAGSRYQLEADLIDAIPPGRMLDIGCANGDFMAVMAERGWQVAGLESSPHATNPHGLPITSASFPDDAPFETDSFDLITAWAVFEHLHDPSRAFAEVSRMLKPDGTFVIVVPNFRSVSSLIAREEDVPRHLFFFTPSSVDAFARSAGMHTTKVVFDDKIYPAHGRGALRRLLWRALGGTEAGYFAFLRRSTRRQRFQRRPVFALLWYTAAAIERVVLRPSIERITGTTGTMVVFMTQLDAESTAPSSASVNT